jgi:hypothetical protein
METQREWELKALCCSYDPEIWFSKTSLAEAKRLCLDECPVREECLAAILSRESETAASLRSGIVAGLTGAQRAKLASAQHRAPKAEKPAKKPPGPGRKQSPCGTRGAYQRHLRKGEPIDQACRDAHALGNREYRRTGSTQVVAAR